MSWFLIKRLAMLVPTLLIVSLVAFSLIHLVPGDPAVLLVGETQNTQLLAETRARLGLGQPLPQQFLTWLGQVAGLDFGESIVTGEPVFPLLLDRFGVTAYVVVIAAMISTVIAVLLGMLAAWWQDTKKDRIITVAAILALSVPSFWLAIMLILLFGVKLGWLPTVGYIPPSKGLLLSISFIILPVISLTLIQIGTVLRMARASAIEVIRLEYVTYARSKGLSDRMIILRHVLPNALAPVLTIVGFILGNLLAGAAVIETVFTLPGLGRLLVDSIFARDYPVIQGAVLFIAVIYVTINLLVDLAYPLLDPKVKL
jgi:peptide/nickel transport system permease protein